MRNETLKKLRNMKWWLLADNALSKIGGAPTSGWRCLLRWQKGYPNASWLVSKYLKRSTRILPTWIPCLNVNLKNTLNQARAVQHSFSSNMSFSALFTKHVMVPFLQKVHQTTVSPRNGPDGPLNGFAWVVAQHHYESWPKRGRTSSARRRAEKSVLLMLSIVGPLLSFICFGPCSVVRSGWDGSCASVTPAQKCVFLWVCVCHRAIVTHLQTCPCRPHKITREHKRQKVPPFQENLSLYLLDDHQTRLPFHLTKYRQ